MKNSLFYDSKDKRQFTEWLKDRVELVVTGVIVSIPIGIVGFILYAIVHFFLKYW